MDQNKLSRMEELVSRLNAASEAYYGGLGELMSDFEWDAGFDELSRLERETGVILENSPTHRVSGSDSATGLKEPHEYPALSLAKTKLVPELQEWVGEQKAWLSWKLDGLTLVLTYDGGSLTRILTRGDGTVGTNITYMKTALSGFPLTIPEMGHLVVRGEAVISYPDFEEINASMEEDGDRYANPRNLASGTLALDAKNLDTVRARKVCFHAFTLVHTDEEITSHGARMDYLANLGFTTVDREAVTAETLPDAVDRWTRRVEQGEMPLPVDGLVLSYDDTVYAEGGSVTGHHATRAGLAFKWQDQPATTTLDHIEWSCGASVITPVAVFDPVQLEGTTVSRASLVNLSEMDRLGIGADRKTVIRVIKANKIIPKVIQVVSAEGAYALPDACPVCGERADAALSPGGVRLLKCTGSACPAKHLKKFQRFVSKQGCDIDGLSIEGLRDFVAAGFIRSFPDIFRLEAHGDAIASLPGFGEKSRDNLLSAIDKVRRDLDPVKLLNALCIPQIGVDAAKRLMSACGWQGFLSRLTGGDSFADIDGFGEERSCSIREWYEENRAMLEELLGLVNVRNVEPSEKEGVCKGMTFVITGDVHVFKNRDAFKARVESLGGKVAGSVSKKTDFLVNNDSESTSSKNQKARELGIPILTEDEFIERFGTGD